MGVLRCKDTVPEHGPGFTILASSMLALGRANCSASAPTRNAGRLLRARLDGLVANREKVGPADPAGRAVVTSVIEEGR